jgi:hypothetical protein
MTEKSLGIPAIRAFPLISIPIRSPEISLFIRDLAASLCQARLFHIDENSALESSVRDFQNGLSGGESAPGG